MTELWDIYTRNRAKTGELIERGHPMRQDQYHLVVNVWIHNSKGEWLISQRCPEKSYPLMWEPTGGSVLAGETSVEGAVREVREELGIDLDPRGGHLLCSGIRQYDTFPDILDVWVFEKDYPIDAVILQEGETIAAKWASNEEIRRMIREHTFIPYDKYNYLPAILETGKQ